MRWNRYEARNTEQQDKRRAVAHYSHMARIAELESALRGLFEHCAMVHKHWGDGSNAKAATTAIEQARAVLQD